MLLKKTTLALALLLGAAAVQAATFTFNGIIDFGPQTGQSFSGQYSYAEAGLTGFNFESLTLSSFNLSLLGQSYGLAGVTGTPTADFQDGQFLGLSYQFKGASSSVVMAPGSFDLSDAYLHYTPTGVAESSGGYAISTVPEPSSWALSLAGLLAVGVMLRRRQAGV